MILRRLAEAIKRQDWFVVLLEFLIVVTGIFGGLQVDDWNKLRQDRALERQYLARLLPDIRFNIEQVDKQAQSYLHRADGLSRIVEQLEAGGLDEIDPEIFTVTFCYWYSPENISLQWSTYDELTSTGGLELIRDTGLRRLLQLAWAGHERVVGEIPLLGALQTDIAKSLRRYTKWQLGAPLQIIDVFDAAVEMRAGCIVDKDALAADPDISSILVELNRSQTILGGLRLEELRALKELYAALEEAVATGGSE